ncbi:MAG TPA: hypothetical protein PKV58_01720, partial [Kaistella sp.]|nr:hypothetical protein [Kaistella sp.]
VEGNWVGKNKKDRVKSGTGFEKKRKGVAPFLHEANEHLCNCGIDTPSSPKANPPLWNRGTKNQFLKFRN